MTIENSKSNEDPKIPVVRTETQADDARITDHLANERTYLAWIRTGVAMMGLGVVIAKLRYMMGTGSNFPESSGLIHAANIGLLFALIGVLTIIMSVVFFLTTQKEIRQSSYKARKVFVLIIAALTGALGLVILWYLEQPVIP
jgi:putative membrane protein